MRTTVSQSEATEYIFPVPRIRMVDKVHMYGAGRVDHDFIERPTRYNGYV
jgi:hypothetical protein